MPELPEVETVVREVRPLIVGRTVTKVLTASELMVRPVRGFSKRLAGQKFTQLDRQGKWMFLRIANGDTFVLHLGMTGSLAVTEAQLPILTHTHLRLALDDGRELRFCDPRRFGELVLCQPEEWNKRFGEGKLGPDALVVSKSHLAATFAKTRRNLKSVLLDQRVIAGIGNIYADEILHASRLAPSRGADSLSTRELGVLHRKIRLILQRAIASNGTTIRDYVTAKGVPGEFQESLRVYGRADQPCKNCSTRIELVRTIVSGRSTYWCPKCQRA